MGKNAAIESLDEVLNLLGTDTSMVFLTAGMGGGTGTGAAPVIAQACKERGILTVGIVTVPFLFEGRRRNQQASEGLEQMRAAVDTLLIIRNDKLRELFGNQTIRSAFANADQIPLHRRKRHRRSHHPDRGDQRGHERRQHRHA